MCTLATSIANTPTITPDLSVGLFSARKRYNTYNGNQNTAT